MWCLYNEGDPAAETWVRKMALGVLKGKATHVRASWGAGFSVGWDSGSSNKALAHPNPAVTRVASALLEE